MKKVLWSNFKLRLSGDVLKPLNAELNPICHLLALLGGATIVLSRLRVICLGKTIKDFDA
jgi:hypothetical protein